MKLNREGVEWVFHLGPMTAWLSSLGCRLQSPVMLKKKTKQNPSHSLDYLNENLQRGNLNMDTSWVTLVHSQN